MTVSSAYMITSEKLMHDDGRSLIYNINNTGPRMLHCGTLFPTATGRGKLFLKMIQPVTCYVEYILENFI